MKKGTEGEDPPETGKSRGPRPKTTWAVEPRTTPSARLYPRSEPVPTSPAKGPVRTGAGLLKTTPAV